MTGYIPPESADLISILSFHHLLSLHHLGGRDRRSQSLRNNINLQRGGEAIGAGGRERGLTSAFRSERILTMHLFTVIWKVKLMTPLIFSSTFSHRLLRLCQTPQTQN